MNERPDLKPPAAEDAATRADYHALVRSEIFPLVPMSGGTLLDVGGGVGATAAELKRLGHAQRAGVVDLVPTASAAPGLDFHLSGNLEKDDVLDRAMAQEGPFQTILALDVLEHLVDPWDAVRRLHAMLAPGGVIVASIPNVRYYSVSFPLLFQGRWELQEAGLLDRTHLRWFVRETAIALMTSSGLTLEAVVAKPGSGRKVKLIRRLTLGLASGLTDFQYLIRVKRTD